MTLPFRRRHNDAEASHDRARSLIAAGFLEPIGAADSAWLDDHLETCLECRNDAAAYEADRILLRSLRDRPEEPPRDLWARTAADIERSRGRRDRSSRPARRVSVGRAPLGVMAGLLVVLVVVGASLAPRSGPSLGPAEGTDTARESPGAEATPIVVNANALAWIQLSPDGSYEFLQANVNEVCADARDGCAPLNSRNSTRLILNEPPQALLLSPDQSQIAVVTQSASTHGSDIVVVAVPVPPTPSPSLPPSAPPSPSAPASFGPGHTPNATSSGVPATTPTPIPTAVVIPSGSDLPTFVASNGPGPSGSVEPSSGHAIVTGVVIVGDAAYSQDGTWLAFSARPADGGTGPDLYTWHVGDDVARQVTTDHRTFFSGWLGNRILANRVESAAAAPDASAGTEAPANPEASADPSPTPTATTDLPGSSADATDGAPAPVAEDQPIAFLVDPLTDTATPLGGPDIWHPTVDPTGRSIVYWSGTLVPNATGTGWRLGTGQLVIDGWIDGSPTASGVPSANPSAPSTPGSPTASDVPTSPPIGPAGHPVALTDGPITDFDAWFDPTGTRLAIWTADPADPSVGTLRLVVLDPDTLQVDTSTDPLPGVAALRGVSISNGRLAWVTPPGQDGQGSHVQVLAWKAREFGQVRTIQGDRFLVAR